jgi:TonB family protein
MRMWASLLTLGVAFCAVPTVATAQFQAYPAVFGPPCADGYSADLFGRGSDRAELRIVGRHPFTGDVTVFGQTRRGHVGLSSAQQTSRSPFISIQIVSIRNPDGVEAVSFRPPGASCDVSAVAADAIPADSAFFGSTVVDAVADGALEPASCERPYRAASIERAMPVAIPAIAQQQGISGRVIVLVGVDETGRVVSARVYQSPSALLNAPSIFAARQSLYRPAILRCAPVSSTIAFAVDYTRF